MRIRALITAAAVLASIAAAAPASADPAPLCQFDVTGRTVTVLPVPANPIGGTVWVERIGSHTWHHIAYRDSRATITGHLHHRASQSTLRVRIDGMRCETT